MSPEENPQTQQISFLLSDFNVRLRDLEERNRTIKERVLLLGKNLISLKDDLHEELKQLKTQTNQFQEQLEKLTHATNNFASGTEKFARKDDMLIIERMLKDFQPLDFVREKDVEEIIDDKLKEKKNKKIKRKNK